MNPSNRCQPSVIYVRDWCCKNGKIWIAVPLLFLVKPHLQAIRKVECLAIHHIRALCTHPSVNGWIECGTCARNGVYHVCDLCRYASPRLVHLVQSGLSACRRLLRFSEIDQSTKFMTTSWADCGGQNLVIGLRIGSSFRLACQRSSTSSIGKLRFPLPVTSSPLVWVPHTHMCSQGCTVESLRLSPLSRGCAWKVAKATYAWVYTYTWVCFTNHGQRPMFRNHWQFGPIVNGSFHSELWKSNGRGLTHGYARFVRI